MLETIMWAAVCVAMWVAGFASGDARRGTIERLRRKADEEQG